MTSGIDKRKALGKGLSALLPSRPPSNPPLPQAETKPVEPTSPTRVAIERVVPNPGQPRTIFHPDQLEELAQSIRVNGIIQPLVVRQSGDNFEIVAGERRWRAAKLAGLAEVPIVVQEISNDRLLEIALIENIQREDLNPLEAAKAFDRLSKEFGLTQEEIGRRTGKDRTSIANIVRLLKLPPDVQMLVAENRLSMGQARAILGLATAEEQIHLAEKAAANGLSAREVERQVKKINEGHKENQDKPEPKALDPNVKAAITELERTLGTRVRITEQGPQKGRIEIDYYSQEELQRIYSMLVGS